MAPTDFHLLTRHYREVRPAPRQRPRPPGSRRPGAVQRAGFPLGVRALSNILEKLSFRRFPARASGDCLPNLEADLTPSCRAATRDVLEGGHVVPD
jgi:hypothetical protein